MTRQVRSSQRSGPSRHGEIEVCSLAQHWWHERVILLSKDELEPTKLTIAIRKRHACASVISRDWPQMLCGYIRNCDARGSSRLSVAITTGKSSAGLLNSSRSTAVIGRIGLGRKANLESVERPHRCFTFGLCQSGRPGLDLRIFPITVPEMISGVGHREFQSSAGTGMQIYACSESRSAVSVRSRSRATAPTPPS